MKQQIMSLKMAIKENYISTGTELIRYIPDYNEVEVIEKRTGFKEKQKFKTNLFSWKLVELENKQVVLIPINSTDQFLSLQGKAGAEKSKKTLNNICSKLWSSKSLKLEAKTIDITDYKQMPSSVKQGIKNIWLGNHNPVNVNVDFVETVYYVDEYSCCKNYPLYSRKHGEQTLCKEIFPIIYLPDNVLIDISTKMIFRERRQLAQYKLSKLIEKTTIPTEIRLELEEIMKLL